MAVPAWTATQWRPHVRPLCERLLRRHAEDAEDEQLLRVDRVVTQLYNHRYMETTPNQVKQQVDEMVVKFQVHSLAERGVKLQELAQHCDFLVLRTLLELADAPTKVSASRIQVDTKTPDELDAIWSRLLKEGKDAQLKREAEAALAANMEKELLQIAWEDDWWHEREAKEEDDDDDESELDDLEEDEDDDDVDMERMDPSIEDMGIAVDVLGRKDDEESGDVRMPETDGEAGPSDDEDEDDLLLRYYRPVVSVHSQTEANTTPMDTDTDESSKREHQSFALDVPTLLYPALEASHYKSQAAHSGTSTASVQSVEPRRVVQEQYLVESIFHALHGIESPVFEFRRIPVDWMFHGDFETSIVSVSSLTRRGLALSHLSPLTMDSVLQKMAQAASDLQFLRELVGFILSTHGDRSQSSTAAEGLANVLAKYVWKILQHVGSVKVAMEKSMEPTFDPSDIALPTLLGTLGRLKELFTLVSWLSGIMTYCFGSFRQLRRHEVRPAELSSQLLTALHEQLMLAYIEGSPSVQQDSQWSRYDILLDLFAGSLCPYLDGLERMLFRMNHADTIPLHPELFFIAPETSVLSPSNRRHKESFDEAVLALMPFRVSPPLVPSFFKSLIPTMSDALLSRQMKNRYLHQRNESSEHEPNSSQSTLSERFLQDLSTLQFSSSAAKKDVHMSPFKDLVERCVCAHIRNECLEISGTIAQMFRDRLHFVQHVEALRHFVLMHEQDVYTTLVTHILEQIQLYPVGWADSERINQVHQNAIQTMHEEFNLSDQERAIASRIRITVDIEKLQLFEPSSAVNILAIRCLQFGFTIAQPLSVMFTSAVLRKYSLLSSLLIQVKLAELVTTKLKLSLRHRRCSRVVDDVMREQLVHVTDMLQFTRCILHYLANQMTGPLWIQLKETMQHSKSVAEINAAHEKYLDQMQNQFLLLPKHEPVMNVVLGALGSILGYVRKAEGFIRLMDRNLEQFFPEAATKRPVKEYSPEFQKHFIGFKQEVRPELTLYTRSVRMITVMLDGMVKHGASPHIRELFMLLTYNNFRAV
ncbi:hypothetical protein Poli38472_005322 [Pythium oligandrum]|uniref:Spindle pole body component n=1 Tax=Pythium oligandrum TaxID=41045 RepID=A0A8K1CGN8_PYTOL|nr:hypothetical protein Poli38472_005322 [Pythium oligandrum]|eukprot:TMW62704.1 hypothetical protein Poli38472_005322 [Pythium oligandrum]